MADPGGPSTKQFGSLSAAVQRLRGRIALAHKEIQLIRAEHREHRRLAREHDARLTELERTLDNSSPPGPPGSLARSERPMSRLNLKSVITMLVSLAAFSGAYVAGLFRDHPDAIYVLGAVQTILGFVMESIKKQQPVPALKLELPEIRKDVQS